MSSPARVIFRVNWEEKEGRELWSVLHNSTRYEQLSPGLGQAERESRVLFPNSRQQFPREARGAVPEGFPQSRMLFPNSRQAGNVVLAHHSRASAGAPLRSGRAFDCGRSVCGRDC